MNKHIRLIVSLGFFGLVLLFCLVRIHSRAFPPGSRFDWGDKLVAGEYVITRVDPNGPAGALRVGDRLRTINGVVARDDLRAFYFDESVPPGTSVLITVLRGAEQLTVTVRTSPRPPPGSPWAAVGALLFWLTGLCVYLLKPADRQACVLGWMLCAFAGLLGGSVGREIFPAGLGWLVALARIASLASFPLLLHLFLVFPQPAPWLRRWPRLTAWLYLPFVLFILPYQGVGRLPVYWRGKIVSTPWADWVNAHGLMYAAWGALVLYLALPLWCLWQSYRAADAVGRRRLRVLLAGVVLGFGNLLLIVVLEAGDLRERFATLWQVAQTGSLFTLPLVPLTFAYAILRHRVIPISLIIRRGVRYLLVSRGSILLALLFTGLIVATLLALLFKYLRPSALTIGLISAGEGIAAWQLARWWHRRYLAPVIDRQFFRQSYDAQQIVAELSESLRTTTDTAQLLEAVADKLQAALQTESVMIFLRDAATGDYQNAYGCLYSKADGRAVACGCDSRLPHYAATLAELAQTGAALELDGGDPDFDLIFEHSRLTKEERQTLRELKTALLLPLKSKDEMPGVIALGSRLGDLPFSGEDKRLLQSVAASAALALENAQLVERMLADARRHQEVEAENEQHAKELEEARQLQLSMLPRSIPQLPNLEIAAFMQTATEVGGDYYDFHLSSDGTLTIAIGDATGHGLKAGTVVTATKSLFKHLAQQPDVVTTMHDASRALKQMNLRSLFMALTLVKVKGERLHCSVAGMPPILIYRATTQDIEELSLRGAPLGGMTHYNYREAEITLAANDVLLLMSDGLTERFNPDDEMFDYERTKTTFSRLAHTPPHAIADGLLKASEEWAAGRPLDDDLTLVVLKRKPDA